MLPIFSRKDFGVIIQSVFFGFETGKCCTFFQRLFRAWFDLSYFRSKQGEMLPIFLKEFLGVIRFGLYWFQTRGKSCPFFSLNFRGVIRFILVWFHTGGKCCRFVFNNHMGWFDYHILGSNTRKCCPFSQRVFAVMRLRFQEAIFSTNCLYTSKKGEKCCLFFSTGFGEWHDLFQNHGTAVLFLPEKFS